MGKDYVVKKQNTNSGAKKAAFLSNLKFFGMSLISNDTCVEARKKPWYAAVIIALLSTLIAMSPVMSNYFNTSGGSFMNSPVYNMDNALVDFDAALTDKKLSCKIQDGKLIIDSAAWKSAFPIRPPSDRRIRITLTCMSSKLTPLFTRTPRHRARRLPNPSLQAASRPPPTSKQRL